MSEYIERLGKANAAIGFTNIRGRDYAEVSQRILAFWSLFPNGRIVTEKVSDDGKRCDFRCEVYRDAGDAAPVTTGTAFEMRQGNVNSTSYIENCETSAIGRALGILGIGSAAAVASADEVSWAMQHQQAAPQREHPAAESGQKRRMWEAVKAYAEKHGRDPKDVLEGVRKRPDYADTEESYATVAAEFEADLDG